jgi:hypothetical protein
MNSIKFSNEWFWRETGTPEHKQRGPQVSFVSLWKTRRADDARVARTDAHWFKSVGGITILEARAAARHEINDGAPGFPHSNWSANDLTFLARQ